MAGFVQEEEPALSFCSLVDFNAHLERHDQINPADVAYTLATGRSDFEHRRAVVCRENRDATTALHTLDPNCIVAAHSTATPRVVFMFPGQRAQHVNMGVELYRVERVFREHIDGAAETLKGQLGLDLRDPGDAA